MKKEETKKKKGDLDESLSESSSDDSKNMLSNSDLQGNDDDKNKGDEGKGNATFKNISEFLRDEIKKSFKWHV